MTETCCVSCGSNQTASAAVVYARGTSGNTLFGNSTTGMAAFAAPPKKPSIALALAIFLGGLLCLPLAILIQVSDDRFTRQASPMAWLITAGCLGTGFMLLWQKRYRRQEWRSQMNQWQRLWVCQKCGKRFYI